MPRYQTTLSVPSDAITGAEAAFEVVVAYDVIWGAPETGPTYSCGGTPADPDEVDDVSVLTVDGVKPLPDLAAAVLGWIEANHRDTHATLIEKAAEQADESPDPDDARDRAFDDSLHSDPNFWGDLDD